MLLADFNKTIDIWIEELAYYDIESLRMKPDRTGWSMGQLYMHILHETTWYFEQIGLCFSHPEHADEEMLESAKTMFHNNSFPDEIIKGDPLLSENVKQPEDIQSLLYAFQQLKAHATDIWAKIKTSEIYGKSRHPGFQFLDPGEWFQFAEMHMRHHLKQKSRIDAFLGSQPSPY